MSRIVVLGAGESGAGAAVLARAKGFDVFVSDSSSIKPTYKELLDLHGIEWEEGHCDWLFDWCKQRPLCQYNGC